MCLGVPGKVIDLNTEQGWAEIEFFELRKKVAITLLDDVRVGDHLLVHAGYAIEKIDMEEAERTLSLLEETLDERAE